jgi:hypothetical protein
MQLLIMQFSTPQVHYLYDEKCNKFQRQLNLKYAL